MPDTIYIDPSETNASVIQLNGQCFERVGPSDRVPTVSSVDYEFDTCEKCERDIFRLVDCDGVEDDVVVDNPDWAQHVGKVFDVDGTCRTVTEGGNPNDVIDKSPGTPKDSCVECWGCDNALKCSNCCFSADSKVKVTFTLSGFSCVADGSYPFTLPREISVSSSAAFYNQNSCEATIETTIEDAGCAPQKYMLVPSASYNCSTGLWQAVLHFFQPWDDEGVDPCDGCSDVGLSGPLVANIDGDCCTASGSQEGAFDLCDLGTVSATITVLHNGCCRNSSNNCEEGSQDCDTGECVDDGGGA